MGRRDDTLGQANECAWGMFLDTLICRVGDIGDGEALVLVAPAGGSGVAERLVIRTDHDANLIWVTRGVAGGTAAETLVARASLGDRFTAAEAIVRCAREELRLPHPQLFTATAEGEGASRVAGALMLDATLEVAEPPVGEAHRPVIGGSDEIVPVVLDVVRSVLDVEPWVDGDGDVAFGLEGSTAWVVVPESGSWIQLWARVAHGVHSRRNTAVELGLLNRDAMWTTWELRGRDVFQRLTVPARPLVPAHLEGLLTVFAADLHRTREDLAYRTGAEIA